MTEFKPFPKLPRLSKDVVITEKLDGTNGSVWIEYVDNDLHNEFVLATNGMFNIRAGSRNRFITLDKDNYGFAKWVQDNAEELMELGHGTHFGEWWGKGIQRGYNLDERKFSLFNVGRWSIDELPDCVSVVPTILKGSITMVDEAMSILKENGSIAAPGYTAPEGMVIFHTGSRQVYKKTFDNDVGKWCTQ